MFIIVGVLGKKGIKGSGINNKYDYFLFGG